MVRYQDFQPGDGTRYEMALFDVDKGVDGKSKVVCVLNQRLCFELGVGVVSEEYLQEKWPDANPWTVKATLVWLELQGFRVSYDLEGIYKVIDGKYHVKGVRVRRIK